ncbi:hypothetical protein Q1695_003680 [Nippostrongylus brasiliensis]|nr:hypothetical protein Q1695_003680 [Nippostrongylus brasiliensis]
MVNFGLLLLLLVGLSHGANAALAVSYVDDYVPPVPEVLVPPVVDSSLVAVAAPEPAIVSAVHPVLPMAYPIFPYQLYTHRALPSTHVRNVVHTYARETGQIRDTSIRTYPPFLRAHLYRQLWNARRAAQLHKTLKQKTT